MLHIDIHDDETGRVVRIGNLEQFVNLALDEIGGVATVFTAKTFRKRAISALHRIIQRVRDESK